MSYGRGKWGTDQTKGVVSGGLTSVSSVLRRSRHKHFVIVLCEQRTMDAAVSARLDACHRLSRLYFSHFATLTVDNTVDLYAAKPDIRPESRFFAYPTCIRRPRGSRRNIATPFGVQKLEWCGEMVKKFRIYVYSFLHDPRT